MKTIVAIILLCSLGLMGCSTTQPSLNNTEYEYKAMSLAEMFKGDKDANKKIADIMVTVSEGFNRTDMDAVDYTEALNRLAADGWELVTVNKSNYWIFRRRR